MSGDIDDLFEETSDEVITGLQAELAGARKENRKHRTRIKQLRTALGIQNAIDHASSPAPITRAAKTGSRQATMVVLASDWHVEETIDSEKVNGINAYSPEIARARVENMAVGVEWKLRAARHSHNVRNAVLWLGGDLISGSIHMELVETNSMGPIPAVIFAEQLCEMLIDYIADCDLDRLQVVCSRGNHGRMTQKTRIKTNAENSLEQLLYHGLRKRYKDHPVVDVSVAPGAQTYLDVYGYTLRFQHGDAVRSSGGIGGIWPSLLKAQHRWQQLRRANIDHLGHFHQLRFLPTMIVNGSLIGTGEYSLNFGHEEPAQGMYLLDEERGPSQWHQIWVTD